MIPADAKKVTARLYDEFSLTVPLFLGVLVIWVLFILDIVSTLFILEAGGIEKNILMSFIVQWPLLHTMVKILVLILIVFVSGYCNRKIRHSGTILVSAIIGVYVIVITNNLTELNYLF